MLSGEYFLFSKLMISFDASRPDFAPYGFTCERWTPRLMERPDRHNEIELNLLTSGSLTYLLGGNKVIIGSGRLAVFWAAIPHQIVATTDEAEYYVATIPLVWFLQSQFPGRFVHSILQAHVVLEPDPLSGPADEQRFEQWVRDFLTAQPIPKRIVLLEMKARLLRLALGMPQRKTCRRKRPSPQFLLGPGALTRAEQMACFIARHYTEPITAGEIGSSAKLHPNYAMVLFRKTFGMTMIDYVTQHRISHAQRLLVVTNEKIVEVANASGFNSLSRFNDAFKKSCGCCPREYRDRHSS